jgi:glycosyltransferase involved in cell wall biosynthesis
VISVLLATYNWPQALSLCLQALREQTNKNFEIIICDDGSKEDTKKLIEEFKADFPVPITHLMARGCGLSENFDFESRYQTCQR